MSKHAAPLLALLSMMGCAGPASSPTPREVPPLEDLAEPSERTEGTPAEPDDQSPPEGDATEAEPVDGGPAEPPAETDDRRCRRECETLFTAGELQPGVTVDDCASALCSDGQAESEECLDYCRGLHGRGELRDGVSVEECTQVLCSP